MCLKDLRFTFDLTLKCRLFPWSIKTSICTSHR